MITNAMCVSYKREILDGVHEPADVYKLALYRSTATLDSRTTDYSPIGEVSGQGYSPGGVALSGYRSAFDGESAYLQWDPPSWEFATITARGALVYNASKGNRAVAVYDFGADITSKNAEFALDFPPPEAALVRIT